MASNTKADKPASKRELSVNKFVAVVAVCLLLAVLVTGFIGKYLGGMILSNIHVISKKQHSQTAINTKLDAAPKLIDEYKNLGAKATLIEHGLPEKVDFPQLVSIIDVIGSTSGVQIKTITPGQAPTSAAVASASTPTTSTTPAATSTASATPTPLTTDFTVEVEGSFDHILGMLRNIEVSARPLRVNSIDFSGSASSLSATLSMTSYYQDPADISDKTEVVK